MITTFLHSGELNIPTSDKNVNEALQEVRNLTGTDWQIIEREVEVTPAFWKFWQSPMIVKSYELFCYVGGCGPWQQINFYRAHSASSIGIVVSADLVVAYLYGILSGANHEKLKGQKC